MRIAVQILLVALLLTAATQRPAAAGPTNLGATEPSGPVILTVSGAIVGKGEERPVRLDRAMLESLGTTELRTTTPWTEGETRFEGVLVRRLMEALGAKGSEALGIALNDYSTSIPFSDLEEHEVLLALRQNGKVLSVRDKGPIWIVYPAGTADHERQDIRARMIWQLKELIVR